MMVDENCKEQLLKHAEKAVKQIERKAYADKFAQANLSKLLGLKCSWCEGFGRRKEQLYFEGAGLKPLP